jgi:hypothetical protein
MKRIDTVTQACVEASEREAWNELIDGTLEGETIQSIEADESAAVLTLADGRRLVLAATWLNTGEAELDAALLPPVESA